MQITTRYDSRVLRERLDVERAPEQNLLRLPKSLIQ